MKTPRSSAFDLGALLISLGLALGPLGVATVARAQDPPPPSPEPVAARFGDPGNRYLSYKLSYVQSDRAVGLLKALGYSVIELVASDSQKTVYDKVFSALPAAGELALPVVIRLIDPDKTSLLEPIEGGMVSYAGGAGSAMGAPLALGGLFLDRVTDGVPLQRLLIVYDGTDPQPMQVLLNLLHDHVDVPAQQLLIEALVIELDQDRLRDLGIDFEGSQDGSSFSFTSSEAGLALPFSYVFQQPSVETALSLNVKLRALVTRGHAQVLARPSVLVLDGRQARIQVGEKIPFTSTISATNTGTLSSTDYLTTGIVLNLRPRISEDGSAITMQVETLISSAGPSTFIPATGVLVAPPIQSREVQTLVRVANDTPFVIGGLISTESQHNTSGVPGLSSIPVLGRLFRKETKTDSKKEVIVVITPHVLPLEDRTFAYAIPKDADIFDSFDKQLFRNVYRLQASDIFDLSFVEQSQVLRELRRRLRERSEAQPELRNAEPYKSLLAGAVPGEEILVRRMLWELIRYKGFERRVDPASIYFFSGSDNDEGVRFEKLLPLLERRKPEGENTLVLAIEGFGPTTMERPFDPPRAAVSYARLPEEDYLPQLRRGNPRRDDGSWERNTVLLTETYSDTTPPLDRLRGVLVLKRMLDLNGDLPLTLRDYHVGREVTFPSESDLDDRVHLIDRETLQLFYETEDYYMTFEKEFSRKTRQIMRQLEGGSDAGGP